jgi:hypothetical protein
VSSRSVGEVTRSDGTSDSDSGDDGDVSDDVDSDEELIQRVKSVELCDAAPVGNAVTVKPTWSQSVAAAYSISPAAPLSIPALASCRHTLKSVQCPFNVRAWARLLGAYPDRACAQVMLNGIRRGVDVRFALNGDRGSPHSVRNLPMPAGRKREAERFVAAELQSDVDAGRRAGPFDASPFPVYRVSPIGVVTKKSNSKLRLIHHLSWPRNSSAGSSVNSNIEQLYCPLSSFDDCIAMLNEMGDLSDVWMFKVDIKSAYRCIPVRPADWPLLGCRWKGKLYFDMELPFGMRSSCGCWECYSTAIDWMAQQECQLRRRLLHYIDDFFAAVQTQRIAKAKLELMLQLLRVLGVPVSMDKVEGPARFLSFLGILIDLNLKQIRLDEIKLNQFRDMLSEWKSKSKCTRKQLQSLAGSLLWVTKVVRGGRTFLRRVIDAIRSRSHNFPAPIEESVRLDLRWWSEFMLQFNGVTMIPDTKWTESWSSECQLFTDAAKSGFGARWGKHYIHGEWTPAQLAKAQGDDILIISALELAAIAIAIMTWGSNWNGKRISIRSDNTAAVAAINSGSCRQPLMMELIRELWFTCCTHSFEIRAVHVAGVKNVDADDLSRGAIHQFKQRNPTVNSFSTMHVIPRCLR